MPSLGTGHNKDIILEDYHTDLYHLGVAEVFSSVAFPPKAHRNERNEMESKTLRKQDMKTPCRLEDSIYIENKLWLFEKSGRRSGLTEYQKKCGVQTCQTQAPYGI